jgi:lipopolysaccharide export system protein LptA
MQWCGVVFFLGAFFLLPSNAKASCAEAAAPVNDFFLPYYDESGVKIWDARGSSIEIAQGDGALRIRNAYVQFYGRENAGKSLVAMESASALLQLHPQRHISGTEFVHVTGSYFAAMGTRWTFTATDQSIALEENVQVFFESNLHTPFSTGDKGAAMDHGGAFTAISSEFLLISRCDDELIFDFLGTVEVRSDDFSMACDRLEIHSHSELYTLAMGKKIPGPCLRNMRAIGQVSIEQNGHRASADAVELFPNEGVLVLSGNATLCDENGSAVAEQLILRDKERRIVVQQSGQERSKILLDLP